MNRSTKYLTLVSAVCALVAASHGTPRGSSGGPWIANATTACEKYLTPDLVAAIWGTPGGQAKPVATGNPRVQACVFQSASPGRNIKITLNTDGPASFDAGQKYLVDPVPLPHVGDKASLTGDGIVAVKGTDRTCHIDTIGNIGSIKLSRQALGQKLGEICNQLFALP